MRISIKLPGISLLALAIGMAASPALAADVAADQQANSGASGGVEQIIVTGNREALNQIPMDATFSQSTITPERLLNITPSPAMTVQTLLNNQPSIYATTGGTNGMETQIKFRSFSDGEFGETIAGVPLNDLFNSGVTYQADNRNNALLMTRDLDSVDLYRGVNNPSVNTYNSLGGTINYLPRQPSATMGGEVGIDGGSFGTVNYHATFNTGDLSGIKQTISFERDVSSGWLQNTPDWNDNLYYAGNADIGSATKAFAYFIYNKNRGDAPQNIPQNIMDQAFNFQWAPDIYRSTNLDTNYLGIVGFKSQISSFITLEDEAYTGNNDYQRTSFSNPNYGGPYFIDDSGSGYPFWSSYMGYDGFTKFPYAGTQAYGATTAGCAPNCAFAGTDFHFYGYSGSTYGDRLQATVDLPLNVVTLGGDLNYGKLHSREYWYGSATMPMIVGYNDAWDEHDTRLMWSSYVQDDIHFWDDRVHVTPGVKYIAATTKDNDALGFYYSAPGAVKASEHFTSPTVGFSVAPISDFTIYGSYGKNVKFPDITAFYNAIAGANTAPVTVKPEFAQDLEAGVRYKTGGLTAELNGYEEHFSHIIFSNTTPSGVTQYQNGGNQRYRGIETQLTDNFGEFWIGRWQGYVNASYNEAICTSFSKSDLTGGVCNAGQSLPNVPKFLTNIGLIWDYSNWHVDVQGQYVGSQTLQSAFTSLPVAPGELEPGQKNQIPSYFLVSLGIVKVVPVQWGFTNAVRLGLHVDNLFDTRYYSSAAVNTRNLDMTGNNQAEDFYGLAGEPRAVFASVSAYF